MRQALRQLAIVGQKKKPFALRVEPANIGEARKFGGKQIEDGVARVRVALRGNESAWLVQHDGKRRIDVNEFAIDLDVIARAGLRAEICASLAVDRNPAGRDQLIAPAARADSSRGEVAVEAHGESQKVKWLNR